MELDQIVFNQVELEVIFVVALELGNGYATEALVHSCYKSHGVARQQEYPRRLSILQKYVIIFNVLINLIKV